MLSSQVLIKFCVFLLVSGFVAALLSLSFRHAFNCKVKFDLVFLDVLCFFMVMVIVLRLDKSLVLHGDLYDMVAILFWFVGCAAAFYGRWTIPEDKPCNSK